MKADNIQAGHLILEFAPYGRTRTHLVFVGAGRILHHEDIQHKGRPLRRREWVSEISRNTGLGLKELAQNAPEVVAAHDTVVKAQLFPTPGETLLESAHVFTV